MTKIVAEILRDAALRPTSIKVKGLEVGYEYYPTGAVSKVILSGKRASLPRLFEVLDMIYPRDIVVSVTGPGSSATGREVALAVPRATEIYDIPQIGSGELIIAFFRVTSDAARNALRPRIKCDDVQVMPIDTALAGWNDNFVTATTPGITLGLWSAGINTYTLVVTLPFSFREKLEVGFFNELPAADHAGFVGYSYKKNG